MRAPAIEGGSVTIREIWYDSLFGRGGDDTIEAGTGTDRMGGGVGNDLYRVGAADLTSADYLADEAGTADTLEIIDVLNPATGLYNAISISGALAGRIQGIERFLFGSGNDTFLPGNTIGDTAGIGPVTVAGGAGNDLLNGSQVVRLTTPLAFLLDGGEGADILTGGRVADTLAPGTGADRASQSPRGRDGTDRRAGLSSGSEIREVRPRDAWRIP